MSSDTPESVPFREEALAHHFRQADSLDLLRASPLWTWLTLCGSAALLLAAAAFVSLVKLTVPVQAGGKIQATQGTRRVVAFTNDVHDLLLHRGDRVPVALHGYPAAQFGYLEGRVTQITPSPAAAGAPSAPKSQKKDLARVDIAIRPPATGPLAVVALRNGMSVTVRFATRKKRLISILLGAPLERWRR